MDNLELWNKVKQVPKDMLKPIQAGRLKGKSDINPMWRYQAMTNQFGPIGVGWNYEVLKLWTEAGPANQIFCFAEISLRYKIDGEWSEAIPGIGGHMLVVQESSGLHANDEGYKMAITDALSVAMKMLGFGADVYAGLWDGSKYRDVGSGKGNDTPKTSEPPKNASGDVSQREHWCNEHDTAFFMKGKMKSFAHPIKDGEETVGWCYEHKDKPEDPYKAVKEIAKTRGIGNYDQLKEALGVDKLDQITPEAAMQIIESMPVF